MIMKIRTFILLLLSLPTALHAQLTIDEAQQLARENYPAIKQYELITASRYFTLDNALKAWLPQVSLNGRASYQSDVTKLPIDLSQMGINYKGLNRDQYDAHIMVNQQIYDDGQISLRRNIARAQADVETEKLNVTLYDIRHRVSQLFFGILLIYGFTPQGSIVLLYLSMMLLALIMSGLGLVVSNYSQQMQQAMLVMWFIMVCFLLLSGLFTPVQTMPQWAQTLTLCNPMRYFIDAMRTLYVRGGTWQSVTLQTTVLAAFALVIDTWAVLSYKKNNA